MRRISIIFCLSLIAAPALSHAFLDQASPRVGSSVLESPKEIRLTYTEAVEPSFSHIELFDGGGQPVALGALARDAGDNKQLFVPVTAKLVPGHYEVRWNVLSVDTHRTNGHFTFDYQP